MLKEEASEAPEELGPGMIKKTKYHQEMETLEKVENMNFTRMTMTKEQKKLHRKALRDSQNQN